MPPGFKFYIVTHSYSSRPFLCALGSAQWKSFKFGVHFTRYTVVSTHCSLLPLSLFIGKLLINFQWLLSWLLHRWRRRLSVSNLSSEKKLLTFRLNAPVVIRAKVNRKKTEGSVQRTTCEFFEAIIMSCLWKWDYSSACWKGAFMSSTSNIY